MTRLGRGSHAVAIASFGLTLLLAFASRVCPAAERNQDKLYGFVVYVFDEDHTNGESLDAFPLIKSLGAGWVQGEAGGIGVRTQAIVWDEVVPWDGTGETPDLRNPDNYHYESLAWIDDALSRGLDVVTSIETGKSGWTDNTSCTIAPNCPPKDWNQWYRFVHQVVRHFGTKGVSRFKSTEEACLDWNYFGGSKEDMYGDGTRVTITDADGRPKEVMAGIVPVAQLATHDANPGAIFAVGSAAGGGPILPLNHLLELYNQRIVGVPPAEWPAVWDEVRAQARESYDIDLSGFTAQQVENNRCRQFVEQSVKYPETYDAYGIHLYDQFRDTWGFMTSEGFTRAMFYVRSALPPDKPLWVTGTGILAGNLPAWNPYQEETPERVAHHLLRTLVGAYASGVEWITYSSLGNPAAGCTPSDLCDTSLYGYRNYPYRNEAAGTFSMMARLFPTKDSFSYVCTVQADTASSQFGACRSGWQGDFESSANAVIHKFRVAPGPAPLRSSGYVAAGWCLDMDPGQKGQPWSFDNTSCPAAVSLDRISDPLGIADGDHVAVFGYGGNLLGSGVAGPGSSLTVIFDEAPFVLVWGPDWDRDGIPDVADNCPTTQNADQRDDFPPGTEILVGLHNPAIDAPDGVGYVCDRLPSLSNLDLRIRKAR